MKEIFPPRRLALILAALSGLAQAAGTEALPAELVASFGKTEVRTPGDDWIPARARLGLPARTTVRTGDASWASLTFADQSQIKLAANSLFHVREVAAGPSASTVLELRKGKAWGQAKRPPDSFSVRTPTANAAIQGTDWIAEVADDGSTTLAVLSGMVVLSNEHGSTRVARNEEAIVLPGKAPSKRPLTNPRERTQWLVSTTIAWVRYPEIRGSLSTREASIIAAAQAGRDAEALTALAAWPAAERPAFMTLLESDLQRRNGRLQAARTTLEAARQHAPTDPRVLSSLISLSLASDDSEYATRLLAEAKSRWPQSVEIALAEGEHAVWQGQSGPAAVAFARARELAPGDPRPPHAAGIVFGEREDYLAAQTAFASALIQDPAASETEAELGWVETLADRLPEARTRLEALLARNPQDYVARTALGYLELKSGNPEAAIRHLLDANATEPRYARAVRYLGIAHYQLGKESAARDLLTRAGELDQHDPLPYFLLAQIHADQWQPGEAVAAASEGMRRLPGQKSLNQVASDLKGSASLAAAYARFGLEEWATQVAVDSADAFWAGSRFFLANRQDGEFNRNAELISGFLIDPTAFGVGGRTQPLVPAPSIHGSARYWLEHSSQSRVEAPQLTIQGYTASPMPFSWLVEGQGQRWKPAGDALATANQLTLGLGLKPGENWRLFYYGTDFNPDFEQSLSGGRRLVSGHVNRHDFGLSYRHGPDALTAIKFGQGGEQSRIHAPDLINPSTRVATTIERERHDFGLRHAWQHAGSSGRWQGSFGAEWASADDRSDTAFTRALAQSPSTTGNDRSEDRSRTLWGSLRWHAATAAGYSGRSPLMLQADLAWNEIEIETRNRARVAGQEFIRLDGHHEQRRLQPRIGLAWRPQGEWTVRAAWQEWTRPVSFASLTPVDTAGIVLDDILTRPGGRLERLRLQLEQATATRFTQFWLDHKTIDNVYFGPNAADNPVTELADLSRLQQEDRLSLARDSLEGIPVFTAGRVRETGVAWNQILSPTLSVFARYRHSDSVNIGRFSGRGDPLPYLARHQASLGGQWVLAPRWTLQTRLTWRSERYADELRNIRLRPGWDGTLLSAWQAPRKDWQVEAYVRALGNPDLPTTAGISLVYRY